MARKMTSNFNKQVRSVLMAETETKYITKKWADLPITVGAMTHNTLRFAYLWKQGAEGDMTIWPNRGGGYDTQTNIDGREFYAKGLKVQLQFTIPYDRLDTTVKVWYLPMQTGVPDPASNTFFRDTLGNVMIDPRNMANYKARYLGSVRPRPRQFPFGETVAGEGEEGGRAYSTIRSYYIPFNRTLRYRSNIGSDEQMDNGEITNLSEKGLIVFTAYNQENAVSGEDTVLSNIEGVVTTVFKDP